MKKWFTLVIIMGIVEISLSVWLTKWSEEFYTAIGNKDIAGFYDGLILFSMLALSLCFVTGFSGYAQRRTSLAWTQRIWKTLIDRVDQVSHVDNYQQKIETDSFRYPELAIGLLIAGIKALAYIVVFSILIGTNYSVIYVLILAIYVVIGSLIGKRVAQPLIGLNYEYQNSGASFRKELSDVKFHCVWTWAFGIAKRTKKLTYFQSFVGQVGVILPLLLIAPSYFSSTAMTLGLLMAFNRSCQVLLDNLQTPLSMFATINDCVASRKRLKEVLDGNNS